MYLNRPDKLQLINCSGQTFDLATYRVFFVQIARTRHEIMTTSIILKLEKETNLPVEQIDNEGSQHVKLEVGRQEPGVHHAL